MKTATTYTLDHYGMIYKLDEVKKSFRQYKLSKYEKIAFSEFIRNREKQRLQFHYWSRKPLNHGDTTNWNKCTYTGLRPEGTPGFYYADLKVKDKIFVCSLHSRRWRNNLHPYLSAVLPIKRHRPHPNSKKNNKGYARSH